MNNIEHPDHYTQGPIHDRCGVVVEAITVTQHHNFNVGNAIKYLWRRGLKHHDVLEDLAKARQYIDFEIDRVKYAQARNEDAPPIVEHHIHVELGDLEASPPPNLFGSILHEALSKTVPGRIISQGGFRDHATASEDTHRPSKRPPSEHDSGGAWDIPAGVVPSPTADTLAAALGCPYLVPDDGVAVPMDQPVVSVEYTPLLSKGARRFRVDIVPAYAHARIRWAQLPNTHRYTSKPLPIPTDEAD